MRKSFTIILFILCSMPCSLFSQEGGVVGVATFDIPSKNSLKFNKYIINPVFSFVREDESFLSLYNKRQWSGFSGAPTTYFINYSTKFGDRNAYGAGLFQQNYGIINTFGLLLNFAHNVELSNEDNNLTLGINLGYLNSGLSASKVITGEPDPILQNTPSNSLVSLNPGVNLGLGFFDLGISANNLFFYNFSSSGIITEDPGKSIAAHVMYTGYNYQGGFFEKSKFSILGKAELFKGKTVFGGTLLYNVPKTGWAQAGYNTLNGFSAGVGFTLAKRFSIGYNFEKPLGNFSSFGLSHEIVVAYKIKGYGEYEIEQEIVKAQSTKNKQAIAAQKAAVAKEKETIIKTKIIRDKAEEDRLRKLKEIAEAQARAAEEKARQEAEARLKAEAEAERLRKLNGQVNQELTEAQRKAKEDAERAEAARKAREAADKAAADAREEAARKAREAADKAAADARAIQEAKDRAAANASDEAARKAKEAADKAAADAKAIQDAKDRAAANARDEAARKAKEAADKAAADARAAQDAKDKAAAAAREEAARKAKEAADKAAADARAAQDAKDKAAADAKAIQDAKDKAAAAAREEAARKAKEAADKAAADARAAQDAKDKAAADAKAIQDAKDKAAAAAREEAARKAKEAADKAAADAKAIQDAKDKAAAAARDEAARKAKEAADKAAADAKAIQDAKDKAAADAKAEADRKAKEAADKAAADKAEADRKAKLNAAKTEEDKQIDYISQVFEDAKKNQQIALDKLEAKKNDLDKELKELRTTNDLSEKGIVSTEVKAYKNQAKEREELEKLKFDIAQNAKSQDNLIKQYQDAINARIKNGANKNDAINQEYLKNIEVLKADKLKADQLNANLLAQLEKINVETVIEKNRRIKKAIYVDENQLYAKDRATLKQIKENTSISIDKYKPTDFDYGEEELANNQIFKKIGNVKPGYYLIVASHKDAGKRDQFVTKVVASGEKNVDFFYNVNLSTYYIFYQKYDNLEDAQSEMESKGSKPYNGKMVIVKVEN
jgi:type IX secretion system PorP/SprF family membrane protein